MASKDTLDAASALDASTRPMDSTVDAGRTSDGSPDTSDAASALDAPAHSLDGTTDATAMPDANTIDGAPPTDAGTDAFDASYDVEVVVAQDCPLPPPVVDAATTPDAGCTGITLDGGACMLELATGLTDITGLAVRGGNVVWTRSGAPGTVSAGSIVRASTGGGTPVTLASGLYNAAFVALDDANAYWGGSLIGSVPLTGGAATQPMGPQYACGGGCQMTGLVRAGSGLFWALDAEGIWFVPLPSGAGSQVMSASAEIGAMAASVDGLVVGEYSDEEGIPSHLMSLPCGAPSKVLDTEVAMYSPNIVRSAGNLVVFSALGAPGQVEIDVVPLSGGPVRAVVPNLMYGELLDLVTDGTSIYWLDDVAKAVMKADITSGVQTQIVGFGMYAFNPASFMAIDADSIYFTWTGCGWDAGCTGELAKVTPR